MIRSDIFKNKKVVITGGLGFIGSNIAHRIVNYGAHVVLIDSMTPGCGGNYYNVNEIQDNVEIIEKNLCDEDVVDYITDETDYIFNMAAKTSHMDSLKDPIADMESNVKAHILILDKIKRLGKPVKIVYTSTRQVYGKSVYLPVDEKHLKQPLDINGINKLSGEQYHMLYHRLYGLNCTVLRLTNTYGPRMRIKDTKQNFLGMWTKNIVQGIPIEVWGGAQVRDYNYIDDVVDALVLSVTEDKAIGKIYNLGGDETITLRDLAEIFSFIDKNTKINSREFPEDRKLLDIGDFYSDAGYIKGTLGWAPKIKLQEGLKKTLEYYQKNLEYYL